MNSYKDILSYCWILLTYILTRKAKFILNFLVIVTYTFGCVLKWSESRSVVSDSLQRHGLYSPWNSPGQHIGVDSLSLLQGIFTVQRSNPGLLHCRWILYHLSHKGSPRILEWVAYAYSVFVKHLQFWYPNYRHIYIFSFSLQRFWRLLHFIFTFFKLLSLKDILL